MKRLLAVLLSLVSIICVACTFTACGDEEETGTFYTVTEAYELGYLTREDVMSIAYYNNGGTRENEEIMGEDYAPLPRTPEELTVKTENAIKKSYYNAYYKDNDYTELSDVRIFKYFGTYNDCVAVMMVVGGYDFIGKVWYEEVDGINIYYGDSNRIRIWRKS